MTRARQEVLEWAEQGRIAPRHLRRALELARVLPTAIEWRGFLDRLLLWLGAVMIAAGVIFFFAYNWQGLGRYVKFAMAEVPIAVVLVLIWWKGLEQAAGKAALLAAAVFTGALLALIGQTYQTGADTFELFAAWAVAILPWVVVGRLPALWILWLVLVNLAVTFYFQAFHGLFGLVFAPERQIWLLSALNTAALSIWEVLAARGVAWLRERWATRLMATAGGAFVTTLAVFQIVGLGGATSGLGALAWFAWLAAAYAVYRRRIKDMYVLAGGVLSVIVVVATFTGKHLLDAHAEAGAFLFIGLLIIGLSAAGGWWLKTVAKDEEAA